MAGPMLRVDAVSAGYDGFQALFGVSLEVSAGESVAVIGPNGAGKTTLLRAISKLIDVTGGDIALEGRSLKAVPAYEVIGRGIAQVPEHRRLFPRLTVEENLKMGGFLPSARAQYAERLAYVYSLFPRMQERSSQLAGMPGLALPSLRQSCHASSSPAALLADGHGPPAASPGGAFVPASTHNSC